MPPSPALTTKKSSGKLASLAWLVFKLGFGLFSLGYTWVTVAWKNGVLQPRDTAEEKKELEAAQQSYWTLDREPLPGFRHAFFTTSTRVNIHYVVNANADAPPPRNVAIFVHGFPDSYLLWRHILQNPVLQQSHTLVAVDLPGYGGSDSLPNYGPYELLEAMAEFIIGVRKQFLQPDSKCVVVSHDWGALVSARLASEAPELADRFIITSGIIPHATANNAISQWTLARQMLRTWIKSPANTALIKNAFRALKPVRSQFSRSFYIFCFHLPAPLDAFFATFGNYWFLRVIHSLGTGPQRKGEDVLARLSPKDAAEAMCLSTGPGASQLVDQPVGGLRYGESVRQRIKDRGMSEKIRIYREGVFMGRWEKSLETTAALYELRAGNDRASGVAPRGALKAPTTLVLGERDPAFDLRLALDNVREYLVSGSQVLVVKEAGHWMPTEPTARVVLEQLTLWALSEESTVGKATPFAGMLNVKVIEEI
ncbi:alpha/beta-hydrolase [Didymella exigua CBS 183.55]|uniref:Alpha/beta-hydrolase n=1 Tax=Didymella exigua CBS 183.55 TaxID=1150837 RepID=A0A6A5RBF9_9PLEO|nr:alpha/beta-hydrolase [Didymella exigua CBS 183.55]KAF1925575.1 alpha/beta-hydrolase [Didymella exigua CBS 183.55]